MKTFEFLTAALLAAAYAAQAAEPKPIEAAPAGPSAAEAPVYRAVWRDLVAQAIRRGEKKDYDRYTAWERFSDKVLRMPPKPITGRGFADRTLRHRRGDVSRTFQVSGRIVAGEFRPERVSVFYRVRDVTHQSYFADIETGRLTGAVRLEGFAAERVVEPSVDDPAVRQGYADQLGYWAERLL